MASGGGTSVQPLRRTTVSPLPRSSASTSSKRWGCRGTTTSSGRTAGVAGMVVGEPPSEAAGASRAEPCGVVQAASNSASSPSRVLVASTTGRPTASRQRRPAATSRGSGAMSNFRLPQTSTLPAPATRRRVASPSVCARTSATRRAAGRNSAEKRRPRRRLRSLSRALASTIGRPAACAAASRFGHTSVSISTPTAGRKCLMKRPAAPGVSYGSQVCRSPGRSSAAPAARPVAVPCVSSRRRPGSRSRSASTSDAAARVSPSDTACSHSQPDDAGSPPYHPSRSPSASR